MNSHVKFFFGLLFPVFVMVALVRIAMNDMIIWATIWSIWTLVLTVAGALSTPRPVFVDEAPSSSDA